MGLNRKKWKQALNLICNYYGWLKMSCLWLSEKHKVDSRRTLYRNVFKYVPSSCDWSHPRPEITFLRILIRIVPYWNIFEFYSKFQIIIPTQIIVPSERFFFQLGMIKLIHKYKWIDFRGTILWYIIFSVLIYIRNAVQLQSHSTTRKY